MAEGQPHVFRFFVEAAGAAGAHVELTAPDVEHARVLRLEDGAPIEVVDSAGTLWNATLAGAAAQLGEPVPGELEPRVELVAGALVGGRFDELVDGAIQAGAMLVVPWAPARKDAERLAARRARLQRIARAAAKQAKRRRVPDVAAPIDQAELLALEPGIIVDPGAPTLLDDAVRDIANDGPIRLLVGPAEGLEPQLVQALVARGWTRGRLGPTILRAELAAAVAVAIAAMHAPRG